MSEPLKQKGEVLSFAFFIVLTFLFMSLKIISCR
jgi:hypothetical protein